MNMKYTPAEASKLLRTLTEEHDNLAARERSLDTFGAFANEDLETVRPDYDYADYQRELSELERKIRTVKHAINVFNVTTVLPDTDGMTIDEALVCLPQLSARKRKLSTMSLRVQKERLMSTRTTTAAVSEFKYANYDIAEAKADYERTVAEITAIQTALDLVNNTEMFEIDV
ncbi:MAG: hypothetical protein LUC38_02780 [Oscillospiraceae bacterium]|nr:hypothetical protein [Ruminococcus sp.]MCD8344870.1 hypothetical protein [Oscillospiraceae bacterium]